MATIELNFKPGFYKNGTPYSRRARWYDGNLIRWHDGAWRPLGGWTRRQNAGGSNIAALIATPSLEAYRDMYAWRDLSNSQNTFFGSNLAAKHMNAAGTITDITPAGYTASNGSKDASVSAGYGQNPYGVGEYGAANNLVGSDPIPPNRWYAANFGELLIYGSRSNGVMSEINPSTLTPATVTNAPSDVQDICVTRQRQVFAIGGGGQPRRVQCTDTEDRTDWTPATANQSIDRTIAGSGRLLRCIPILQHILILGEQDASAARYIGPPYIFAIDQIGENCGPIAPEAVAKTDRFVAWWGERNFWIYDGTVQVLDCEVIDFLYDDIEPNQVSKICAFSNTDFSEIWWLYQSSASTTTEVDSYVAYNYRTRAWITGRINRTCGIDKGVLLYQVMVDPDGLIYNHELDDVLPSGNVYLESGILETKQGERNMVIRFIWPDTENTSDVTFTLYGREFPNTTEYTYGPYSYNNPVPTTGAQGREMRYRVDFQSADAEHGISRLEVSPLGGGAR